MNLCVSLLISSYFIHVNVVNGRGSERTRPFIAGDHSSGSDCLQGVLAVIVLFIQASWTLMGLLCWAPLFICVIRCNDYLILNTFHYLSPPPLPSLSTISIWIWHMSTPLQKTQTLRAQPYLLDLKTS
jgi:hypothetical protein